VREDRGVFNSFTTVRNLTNLIVGTDRRLLAVIVGSRVSGLSDKDYLNLVHVHIVMGQTVSQLEEELRCWFNSEWRQWKFM
jgi:hypothetical protein